MPRIIDYPIVLEQMHRQGLKCLHFNGGAFGFSSHVQSSSLGWIGPADPTLRPEARKLTRQAAEPFEANMAVAARQFWQTRLAGPVWVMPQSHWAYELNFGGREWLWPLLENLGLDPTLLQGRNGAAAVEFSPQEAEPFEQTLRQILQMLTTSDFQLAFPSQPVLCLVHHHKQLWWTTSDTTFLEDLDRPIASVPPVPPAPSAPSVL